ncbi:cell wall-binding repeat-containing protein [Bacillus sp. H-16]|uniref:cell wall-binding repeat-containing protein n=1 Tax=Alteribacter salitolerans TaxID=2912333 RepID=UPI001964553C|nr:cell wall-binding repeat-containing protein [Alteribacter salitolerans]MBM7096211.1 cell wall-binding repeat-containing protein [Alteribacter salitolerans]
MRKKTAFISALLSLSVVVAACSDDHDGHDESMNNEDMDHGEEHDDMEDNDHEEDMDEEDMDHDDDHAGHGGGSREDVESEASQEPDSMNENAEEGLMVENTKNVTRISEDDPVSFSILASQTIWPATHEQNQPGTVILAPVDSWQQSLAALTLVHHPNDGPVLYTDGTVSDEVINEIERLQPKGNSEGIEVMVMGDLPAEEMDKLDGYSTEQITADDDAEFAMLIDEHYAEIVGHLPESVIVGSSDDEAKLMTMTAGDWISHMDEPLLYVDADSIPDATAEALEKRDGEASIYVIGSEKEVSGEVEGELGEYGNVTRISGDSPAELSIAFASFKDEETGFGWGIEEPGHGLTFASTETPELAIPGSPLAHLGKHAPMIWLEEGELSQPVYDYLARLKPAFENDPTEGPYNHGYLFGSTDSVSFPVQGIIDERMEIVSLSWDDHGSH